MKNNSSPSKFLFHKIIDGEFLRQLLKQDKYRKAEDDAFEKLETLIDSAETPALSFFGKRIFTVKG